MGRLRIKHAVAVLSGCLLAGACVHRAPVESGLDRAIERARRDSIDFPYTAADIRFVTGMIGHHSQAIVMSRMAPTHGANPEVRRLAERIINAQQDEIRIMQLWLSDMGEPVPEPSPTGMRMEMGGVEHEMLMPGMLSEEQMARLESARGAEFDRLFLTFMIQHHEGALEMVESLFAAHGGGVDDTIYKMASDTFADQGSEIDRMQRILDAMDRPR